MRKKLVLISNKSALLCLFMFLAAGAALILLNTVVVDSTHTVARDGVPKVALVIDDLGGPDTTGVQEVLSIKSPLTAAVMPNLPHSRDHAYMATAAGHQVILHLPMEAIGSSDNWLGPGAILCNLTEKEIKERLSLDLESVPFAVGINNHTGSRATADRRVMKAVLEVAKEQRLIFMDSRTSGKSVIAGLARELGVPYIKRDVFLDEIPDKQEIRKQMQKLAGMARKNGSAVGIGHVGQMGQYTASTLKEVIPELEKQGIRFVFVTDLAR